MNRLTHTLVALAAGACLCGASRAQAPVDAGRLLEEQQRQDKLHAEPIHPDGRLRTTDTPAPPMPDGPRVTVRRFVLTGNSLLDDATLQDTLRPWLQHPVGVGELRAAANALEARYRDAGWLAHVALPAQDVTEGEVRLAIQEARLGHVHIDPVPAADATSRAVPPRLAAHVAALFEARMPAGTPLNLDTLQRTLASADDLPGLDASGSLAAGTAANESDILVQIAARPLLRLDADIDNAADRSTGDLRATARLWLDSPWGLGERLGLSASKTEGVEYLRTDASAPLGTTDWRLGVSASVLRFHVVQDFNTTPGLPPQGHSDTEGLEATYALTRDARTRADLALGLDQRHQTTLDDDLDPGTLRTISHVHARSWRAGITASKADDLAGGGQTQGSLQFVTGRLDLAGSPADRVASDGRTEATQGVYDIVRWSLGRVQTLSPTLTLTATASGQLADHNLDSSEKLYLGGLGGVAAYPNGEAGGSSGELVHLELRRQVGADWQLGGFYDWGQASLYHVDARADGSGALVARNAVSLQGPGLSLDWHAANGLHMKLVYAHRLGTNPLATANGHDTDGSLRRNRFWVDAGATF